MANYFHSALRGNQIHEAKVKVLPNDSPIPTPEWEGQMLVVGLKFFVATRLNNTLGWRQPTAFNRPQLPENVVEWVTGGNSLPTPNSFRAGTIYITYAKDIFYTDGVQWIRLGVRDSAPSLEIIPSRPSYYWQGNFFGLISPQEPNQENCLLIKSWQPITKYYLAVKTPTILSLGGADSNMFFVELWEYYSKATISSHVENSESLSSLNSAPFSSWYDYRLGMYIVRNQEKQYLNFSFNLDTRLIEVKGVANFSYGY